MRVGSWRTLRSPDAKSGPCCHGQTGSAVTAELYAGIAARRTGWARTAVAQVTRGTGCHGDVYFDTLQGVKVYVPMTPLPMTPLSPPSGQGRGQDKARAAAALAWIVVVSNSGSGQSSGVISSGSSVHPSTTAPAPRAASVSMTAMT